MLDELRGLEGQEGIALILPRLVIADYSATDESSSGEA